MSKEALLKSFPAKRIKPIDGMIITADVWAEAHEYHRQHQRLHTMLGHGAGILTGLEVIASDPPDTSVYILPGIAVDPEGQTIVLPQPVAYDVGHEMEGQFYLLLSYGESRPRAADNGNDQEVSLLYIHAEFSIAARTGLSAAPAVELARVRRSGRDSFFRDAANPTQPGPDEIDLRFRREMGAPAQATIAVSYLGGGKPKQGLSNLAQSLNYTGRHNIIVNDDIPIAPGIETSSMIYMVGQGSFELNPGQRNGLFNYVQKGRGTLFIESLDAPAEAAFLEFLRAVNLEPGPLSPGHQLLRLPHLFTAPPSGSESAGRVLVNEGVIFSGCNYGRLWQGETPASREQLRAGVEWGENIIAYTLQRRRRLGG
jgi:hypothetical protein